MNLNAITVCGDVQATRVYSLRGRLDKMQNRKSYGISLCESGQITYIQNGREYISNSDTAVILPKGASYCIQRDKTGYFPLINFDCLEPFCERITTIPIGDAENLIKDFERINKLLCFENNRANILSIFYGILHKLSDDNIPYELKNAISLIKNNYYDPELTNERLARECKISEVYFRKLFTKYFGNSPKQYIIDMRIQRAKQLLSEGILSIAAISEKCGFTNPYHFSRIFKQHTGKTPSEYKMQNLVYKI